MIITVKKFEMETFINDEFYVNLLPYVCACIDNNETFFSIHIEISLFVKTFSIEFTFYKIERKTK
jgi:hypothetical protein